MRKVLPVILVALLATMGSAVHDFDFGAHHQNIFSHARGHQPDPDDDDGVIYIPPSESRRGTDLDTTMQNLIDDEMATIYHPAKYVKSLKDKLCNQKTSLYNCQIEILEEPTIQVIPTRLISRDLYCNTRACSISFMDHEVDIWTTHTTEHGLKMEAGAEPFNAGVEFTASAGYGFSADSRTFASLAHTFHLRRGRFRTCQYRECASVGQSAPRRMQMYI